MKSLDTNILLYAANSTAPEHLKAKVIVDAMLKTPREWILSDQTLLEFYKALRNPRIFEKPRSAREAALLVSFLRRDSGIPHCTYELARFDQLFQHLAAKDFPYQRTHDAVLAITLLHEGVEEFYTRNTKDFVQFGFLRLKNPID